MQVMVMGKRLKNDWATVISKIDLTHVRLHFCKFITGDFQSTNDRDCRYDLACHPRKSNL